MTLNVSLTLNESLKTKLLALSKKHSVTNEKSFPFQELDILRSFFLLARGELFQNFIEEADTFLNKPPNAATEYDIRQCFVSTIRKLLSDDEDLVNKIKVELNLPKTIAKGGKNS